MFLRQYHQALPLGFLLKSRSQFALLCFEGKLARTKVVTTDVISAHVALAFTKTDKIARDGGGYFERQCYISPKGSRRRARFEPCALKHWCLRAPWSKQEDLVQYENSEQSIVAQSRQSRDCRKYFTSDQLQ